MGLVQWLKGIITEDPVRRTATYEAPPHTAPLVVPAQGDVFDLHVIVHLRWSCDTTDADELEALALERRDGALYTVGRIVLDQARSLDPFQPSRAQAVVNNVDRIREGLCYREDTHLVTCRPSVQVLMDPRLREQLLPFEQQRVELRQQHRLGAERLRQTRERAEDWMQAFQQLEHFDHLGKDERQFLLPYAASLVDGDFAKVIVDMANDRHIRYANFVGVLERATRDHERLGLFEFASAYDKSLQTFCRQMGVDPATFLISDFGDEKQTPERVP